MQKAMDDHGQGGAEGLGEDLRRSCRPSEFLAQLVRKRGLSPAFLPIRGAATGVQVPSRAASLGSPSRSALPVSAVGWARVARIAPPIPMGVHSAAPPLGPASLFDLWARPGTRRRVNSSSAFRAASLACWRPNSPPGSPSVSLSLFSATHLLFAGENVGIVGGETRIDERIPGASTHPRRIPAPPPPSPAHPRSPPYVRPGRGFCLPRYGESGDRRCFALRSRADGPSAFRSVVAYSRFHI